jgi:hypothetical protein
MRDMSPDYILCEKHSEVVGGIRLSLGRFSDLQQRLCCPLCRLLVASASLARDGSVESDNISIGLNYGRISCSLFPMGVEIVGVHLDAKEDKFSWGGRVVEGNEIDIKSPFLLHHHLSYHHPRFCLCFAYNMRQFLW